MDNSFSDQELVAVLRDLVLAVRHPYVDDSPWIDWVPWFDGSGGLVIDTVTVDYARYKVIGKTVFFNIAAFLDTSGTASNYFDIGLPVAPAGIDFTFSASATIDSSLHTNGAYGVIFDDDPEFPAFYLKLADGANFYLSYTFVSITGTYEMA